MCNGMGAEKGGEEGGMGRAGWKMGHVRQSRRQKDVCASAYDT